MQELQERLVKAAEVTKDLQETKDRLENHIRDLESRKRAPLYQKKQEEELRAVTEKAQEAEARALDAEARFKEAKARLHVFMHCVKFSDLLWALQLQIGRTVWIL